MLSGHQLRSILVYSINLASFLTLSVFPVLVGKWRKSVLTGHDLSTDVFLISLGLSNSMLLNMSFSCWRQVTLHCHRCCKWKQVSGGCHIQEQGRCLNVSEALF